MRALVEPPMSEIEADPFHERHRGAALSRDWERTQWRGRKRARGLARQYPIQQVRQKAGELVEQAIDQRRRAARLVLIEQSPLGGGTERRRTGRRPPSACAQDA